MNWRSVESRTRALRAVASVRWSPSQESGACPCEMDRSAVADANRHQGSTVAVRGEVAAAAAAGVRAAASMSERMTRRGSAPVMIGPVRAFGPVPHAEDRAAVMAWQPVLLELAALAVQDSRGLVRRTMEQVLSQAAAARASDCGAAAAEAWDCATATATVPLVRVPGMVVPWPVARRCDGPRGGREQCPTGDSLRANGHRPGLNWRLRDA